MKKFILIPIACLFFIGCKSPKPYELDLTAGEQELYTSLEQQLPLDSFKRCLYEQPFQFFCPTKIIYEIILYVADDCPFSEIEPELAKQAHTIAAFVSTQPIRKKKMVKCDIYFYGKNRVDDHRTVDFRISADGFKLDKWRCLYLKRKREFSRTP